VPLTSFDFDCDIGLIFFEKKPARSLAQHWTTCCIHCPLCWHAWLVACWRQIFWTFYVDARLRLVVTNIGTCQILLQSTMP